MRPDGISLILLAAMGLVVLAELPTTGTTAGVIRLLLLAATAAVVSLEEGRGSRGIYTLCAGQAVVVTGASPAAAVAGEVLLLLLFLRMAGAWTREAGPFLVFVAMAGGVILLFAVTTEMLVPLTILVIAGLAALLTIPLADYWLKREYASEVHREAVQ